MASVASAAFENSAFQRSGQLSRGWNKDGFFTVHPRFIVTPPSPLLFVPDQRRTIESLTRLMRSRSFQTFAIRKERRGKKKPFDSSQSGSLRCRGGTELMKDWSLHLLLHFFLAKRNTHCAAAGGPTLAVKRQLPNSAAQSSSRVSICSAHGHVLMYAASVKHSR